MYCLMEKKHSLKRRLHMKPFFHIQYSTNRILCWRCTSCIFASQEWCISHLVLNTRIFIIFGASHILSIFSKREYYILNILRTHLYLYKENIASVSFTGYKIPDIAILYPVKVDYPQSERGAKLVHLSPEVRV